MLIGDLFRMPTDRGRDMGGNRSRKVRRSGSPQVVPELRPSLDPGPSDDLFEGCSEIRIGPQPREDVFGPLFGFKMKLEKLPLDLGEQGNDPDLSLGVMLRLAGADDREPLRLPSDIRSVKRSPVRFLGIPLSRRGCCV